MKIKNIKSSGNLSQWLTDKPNDWAQVMAVRVALRVLPWLEEADKKWLNYFAAMALRGVALAWMARNYPSHDMTLAIQEAADTAMYFYQISASQGGSTACAFDAFLASKHSVYANTFDSDSSSLEGAIQNSEVVFEIARALFDKTAPNLWHAIVADCSWLNARDSKMGASRALTRRGLWVERVDPEWHAKWDRLAEKLQEIDPNYFVWVDWYDRRIRGERAAFDIPGDRYRKEDKAILRRLAEATEENFWGKGHEFVNAELTRWLEEARAAASQSDNTADTPPQDLGATTYGVNAQGQLDRLPPADQVHLRDVPNQRRSYADLRAAVFELLQEGQRLGPRLQPRLERFGQSLPEDFDRAEAYLVWRDGIALRRLYRAHLAVAKGKDPDPARLEPAAAEGLGEVLDLYNPFAFADDGIRAKDEATIAPQERADAEAEAAAAAPLVSAIMAAPEIATAAALGDISADAEDADLPGDDPYAAQVLDQANRTRGNWIAALLEGASGTLKNPKMVGKLSARGLVTGTAALAPAAAIAFNYAPLLEFIAINATTLQSYVAVAFTSFPHLPHVIDQISALWNRIRNQ